MLTGILIGVGIGLIFAIGGFMMQKKRGVMNSADLEATAQKALSTAVQDLVRTAREQLSAEKRDITETIEKDLKQQSETFRELTGALKLEIGERQREIRGMEEDRNKKYGQIAQALTDYKSLTEELRGSTEQLKRVLASNQLRGSWGEQQAEKILEAAGMIVGQHYAKQQYIEGFAEFRPDFTLFLPNKMELYVDVKFPLNALQEALAATDKNDEDRYMVQFGLDLRARIKEVSKYVVNREKCVDYVLLFVPSESVFEIINKRFAAVIDSSFSQQVILVSPHSFFAVVRTIQESYTHFYYEQNLKEILKNLQDLLMNFERFKGEFVEVGTALVSAQKKFDKIGTTRYKEIARITTKINQYQIDQGEAPIGLPAEVPETVEGEVAEEIATIEEIKE